MRKRVVPRRKGSGFQPKTGRRYRCALCIHTALATQFCYGCRYFVCSACEAYDSVALNHRGHRLEDHRRCNGCRRQVNRNGMGSIRHMDPLYDTKYAEPQPSV